MFIIKPIPHVGQCCVIAASVLTDTVPSHPKLYKIHQLLSAWTDHV